ncbi:MAG: prephenate dehydratase [Bacillota bacterium]
MGVCRQVGYQGEPGAYSEMATDALEPEAESVPCRTLTDVFTRVESDDIDAGVVPVENSLAGSIGETYDLLLNFDLTITGELILPVDHCLLAAPGTSLDAVREVMSHPQALAQCQVYLSSLPAEQVPYYDTAGAARTISRSEAAGTAAVASSRAAEIYGLTVLAAGIQSMKENFTRFYRIERDPRPRGERNKTVIALTLPHQPGSLFMALSSFSCRSLNLTRIESRPVGRNPWEYIFYLEFEGHMQDWQVQSALEELDGKTGMLRVLGSFQSNGRCAP